MVDTPVLGTGTERCEGSSPFIGTNALLSEDDNIFIMSRTYKKPYTKSKRFDKTCRCHGKCSYCRDNRLRHYNREIERINDELNAWKKSTK